MPRAAVTTLHVDPAQRRPLESTMTESEHTPPAGVTVNAGVVLAGLLVLLLGAVGAQVFSNARTLDVIEAKLTFYIKAQNDEIDEARKDIARIEGDVKRIWLRLRKHEKVLNITPDATTER